MRGSNVSKTVAVVALLAAVLWLVEAQFGIFRTVFGGGPLSTRELAMEHLGRHLATRYPGKSVVVLSNPFSQKPGQPNEVYRFEQAGLRGFKRGIGNSLQIEAVAFPEIKPEFLRNRASVFIDPRTTTPLSYLVNEDALDKIASTYPQAEIFVSLIGLPINVRETQ